MNQYIAAIIAVIATLAVFGLGYWRGRVDQRDYAARNQLSRWVGK